MPAPGVELGVVGRAQADVVVATGQAQEIPDLLLAAVAAAPFALDPVLRDLVAQPVAGASENPHMVRIKPDFFLQFPKHRQLGRLAGVDSALWKLPRMLADPFTPKDLILRARDDDGDVRAIPVTVQHRYHLDSAS